VTPKLSPEHEAFRRKRAREYGGTFAVNGVDRDKLAAFDFLAGMNAEHEVARLTGKIEGLEEIVWCRATGSMEARMAANKALLAALLGANGKESDG